MGNETSAIPVQPSDTATLANVQLHPAQFLRVPEALPPPFATKLLSVSLKTPQDVAITVPGLHEHCLVKSIKFILSQPPYNLGQPSDMKLAYNGELSSTACPLPPSLTFCCALAGSILSDSISLTAIGYDAQQFLLLATNRESLVQNPFPVIGACFMAGISHEVVGADEWNSIEQVVSRMTAWLVVDIWD
jgi:hypothetical protein